jgi:hypothetical protein
MPSTLPGMNPYLENPELWSEFHSPMIVAIADQLQPLLHRVYDRARFELAINYRENCSPKLSDEDKAWLEGFLSDS